MEYRLNDAIAASQFDDKKQIEEARAELFSVQQSLAAIETQWVDDRERLVQQLYDLAERVQKGDHRPTHQEVSNVGVRKDEGRWGRTMAFPKVDYDRLLKRRAELSQQIVKGPVDSPLTVYLKSLKEHGATSISDNALKLNGFSQARLGRKIGEMEAKS